MGRQQGYSDHMEHAHTNTNTQHSAARSTSVRQFQRLRRNNLDSSSYSYSSSYINSCQRPANETPAAANDDSAISKRRSTTSLQLRDRSIVAQFLACYDAMHCRSQTIRSQRFRAIDRVHIATSQAPGTGTQRAVAKSAQRNRELGVFRNG